MAVEQPITPFAAWRRQTATGVVLSAIALGLQEALERGVGLDQAGLRVHVVVELRRIATLLPRFAHVAPGHVAGHAAEPRAHAAARRIELPTSDA